jgi:hypothetical protein
MSEFNMSLDVIEDMMPFEREVYFALIVESVEKKKNNDGIT